MAWGFLPVLRLRYDRGVWRRPGGISDRQTGGMGAVGGVQLSKTEEG